MEITIHTEFVIVKLSGGTEYSMNYKALADVETAIKIIRRIQELAHVDSGTIKIT